MGMTPPPRSGHAGRSGRTDRPILVGLSTSSVFPEGTERAFEIAAELGYDGVELMVTADRLTQDASRVAAMAKRYDVPVLSVHAPCLAISARVWGSDPVGKLERSVELAAELGAGVVVGHPPFRWQRGAADEFPDHVADLTFGAAAAAGVRIAIENMYPVRVLGVPVSTYSPDWDVVETGYPEYTLDVSHTAVAGVDALELAARMGDRLAHVHLGDGSGLARDEHLVPGRGIARCAEVLDWLTAEITAETRPGESETAPGRFEGSVILEVSTRTLGAADRDRDLAEALAFARRHLGQS